MTTQKPRILTAEQAALAENPALQNNKATLVNRIEEIKTHKTSPKFETIEEYLADGITSGSIIKDPAEHNDDFIHIKGHLLIDGSKVKRGDWSYVVADSAKVVGNQEGCAIKDYKFLPLTRFGVMTSLRTDDVNEFIKHNACERYTRENGKIKVKGALRIPANTPLPSFKDVEADEVFWYPPKSYKVDVEDLPTANKSFYGISAEAIQSKQPKLAARAYRKRIGKNVCKDLARREQNGLTRWISSITNKFKALV